MKCTRQRCQVAPAKTCCTACLSPRCESEITSFTPARPRAISWRQNASQNSWVLRRPHVEADHLALAAVLDGHGDEHRHGHDAPVLPHLLEGSVEEQVGVLAVETPAAEGLDLSIELAADPAHLILGDALDPQCLGELIDGTRADAVHVGLLHHAEQRAFVAPPRFQQAREVRALAQLRDLQLERAHARIPFPLAVPVAAGETALGALVRRSADQLRHLSVHEFLSQELQPIAQEGRINALLRLGEQVQQCHPGVGHRRGPPVGV